MNNSMSVKNKIPVGFIALYIFIFIAIISAAYYIYYSQKKSIEKDKEDLLVFISHLKLDEIKNWREDKIDDAKVIISEVYFKEEIRDYLNDRTNKKARLKILNQFKAFLSDKDYDKIILIDKYKKPCLTTGSDLKSINIIELLNVKNAERSKKIIFTDFFVDSLSQNIYIDLTIPIIDTTNQVIAALIFRIDPNYSLYPLIQTWPIPDKTSETILFEKRGNNIVNLSELLFNKTSPLKYSLPIENSKVPAAEYVRGKKGIIKAVDYRGKEVVSYGQKVPDTEWYLLTKIDEKEIYSNVRELFIIILILAILLIIIVGFILSFLLNRQSRKHYLEIINIEESKKVLQDNYENLLRNANDLVFVSDESGNFKFVNKKVIDYYGYTEEEILKLKVKDINASGSQINFEENKGKIYKSNGYIFESEHRKKDGTIFPVEISAQIIEIDGQKYFQSFVRDISERKNYEGKINRLNRVYSVLSNINQTIVRIKHKEKLYEEACKIAVNDGGFKMAWIGMLNYEKGTLEIVSSYGQVYDYLEKININPNKPETMLGPTGLCLTLGKHQVSNDIEKDPKMEQWRARALNYNFHSSASFPIIVHNKVIGNITLLSDKKDFFNEEEIKLLDEMAIDISYAIEFLDGEQKRYRIEEELQQSFERYKELFESNPNPMWMYDAETLGFIDVNKTAINKYGYTREEFLSMTLKDIRPDDDVQEFMKNVVRDPDKYPERGIWRHRKKDGSIFFVEVKSNSLPSKEGKNYRIVLVNDITEKLKAEESLKLSEERMRVIVEGTPHLFFYVQDSEANTIYVSPTIEKITGYTTKQWLTRRDWFITNSEINLKAKEVTQAHLRGKYTDSPTLIEIKHSDGHKIILEAYESPIIQNGKVIGTQGVCHDVTERKRADEALKESEERYRTLYENSMVGIYRTTPDGKILMANPAILKMLGYNSFEEIAARNLEETGYEPVYNRVKFIETIERDGKVIGFESAWKRKDGILIYIRENAQAIRDQYGKTIYYDGIVEDITARKLAEDELRKLYYATEQSPASIIITDVNGNIEYVNKRLTQLSGYTIDEVKGKNPRMFQSGTKTKEEYKTLWDTILKGEQWRGEFHNKKKDGTLYWVSATISAIKNKDGKITNLIGVQEDITEKKKTEQLIIKSETELRSVWESSNDAMRLCGEDGTILRVNKAFCDLFERSENEFVGESYQKAYMFKDNASQIFKEVVERNKVIPKQEAEVEMWNGKKIWLEISNAVFETDESKMILSIFRDVSERKAYESELKEAKDRAEEANKTKDLFLANMSHELRTPLIGILGYSDLLSENLNDKEQVEMAKGIKRSGDRLLKTLNLLLDLTRIKSDKFESSIIEKDITEELKFAFEMFRGAALDKKLEFSLQILEEKLTAKVDSSMMLVILENLINNAIKFTSHGSIKITAGNQNEREVFIKVKDTGIGIDEKNFEKIFEEFRQVSEGTNREFQGTGLGLSITKKYVEMLNGTIKVESKINEGTTFTVLLPAA